MHCSSRCNKSTGLLILRLLLGGVFLYHGISKIPMADQAIGFIGGAFHNIGLTFLSMNVWFWLLVIGEITAGVLVVLGVFTRVAAGFIIVVMIGAMHTKGRAQGWFVDKDMILAVLALGLALAGNGAYSLQKLCCKTCGMSCSASTQPTTNAKK